MLSTRLLAGPLAGLTLLGFAAPSSNPDAAIRNAALAPYRDELLRNASALCSDVTPRVAAKLVPSAAPGTGCEQAVQQIFAVTTPTRIPRHVVLALRANPNRLTVRGSEATGIFSLTTSQAIKRHGKTTLVIYWAGRYRLSLEDVAGRWLVSSQATLTTIGDCRIYPPRSCHRGVKDQHFTLGEPVGSTPEESISIRPAVRRAGGREEHEFKAGRMVFTESGCLACHKIGDIGNPGPGQNLTHVGARLSPRELEEVLVAPREPMPSFKHLPARKLHDLVRFLSLLR